MTSSAETRRLTNPELADMPPTGDYQRSHYAAARVRRAWPPYLEPLPCVGVGEAAGECWNM